METSQAGEITSHLTLSTGGPRLWTPAMDPGPHPDKQKWIWSLSERTRPFHESHTLRLGSRIPGFCPMLGLSFSFLKNAPTCPPPPRSQREMRVVSRGNWTQGEVSLSLLGSYLHLHGHRLPPVAAVGIATPPASPLKELVPTHLRIATGHCPRCQGKSLMGEMPEDARRREGHTKKGDSSHPRAGLCQGPPFGQQPGGPVAGRVAQGPREFPANLPPDLHCFPSPDFQPKVQSRLVGRSGLCEGSVEVRQGKQWGVLCDSLRPKGTARWDEVCREQQCGGVRYHQVLDADEASSGFFCPQEKLSQCHQLQEKKAYCRKVFVTCELATAHGGVSL